MFCVASATTPWSPYYSDAGSGERAAALAVEYLRQREVHWVIADLVDKGAHVRTVPVPNWVKAALDNWLTAAGITAGQCFGPINKAQRVVKSGFSPKVI